MISGEHTLWDAYMLRAAALARLVSVGDAVRKLGPAFAMSIKQAAEAMAAFCAAYTQAMQSVEAAATPAREERE